MFYGNRGEKNNERGAALAIAIIIMAILSVIALTALAFSSTEARIAGSDLQRSQTFYATTAGMEKMTNDFSELFRTKMTPTDDDLRNIAGSPPQPLLDEGFRFAQSLDLDRKRLADLRATQNLPANYFPRVNIPDGAYGGLYATLIPYKMTSEATQKNTGTQVKLEREFNNYLVPLFQFGMYSTEDIEVHPGPMMTFNGRVHSNKNIYVLRNTKFLNRLTMAGEFIRDSSRGGESNDYADKNNVFVEVNNVNVNSTIGSMKASGSAVGGPNIAGSAAGDRGYYPDSPNGVPNAVWDTESVKPAANGVPDRFGGKVLTHTTGANELKTPLELAGNSPAELIKRSLPSDTDILKSSRYHSKSQIRILVDDESAPNGAGNVAGIPAGKGLKLSEFIPTPLGGGNVLKLISDTGTVSGSVVKQRRTGTEAKVVRWARANNTPPPGSSNFYPTGSGVSGKVLIEIVKPDGTTVDVTQEILSMGITVGEPNAIVMFQRPIWAAFVQGSRDRQSRGFDLVSLMTNSQQIADGEIADPFSSIEPNRGFISMSPIASDEDNGNYVREDTPVGVQNQIVPINVYNVREGWVRNTANEYDVHERGITSVVELNMHNLARWFDAVYDTNLLSGTNAVSTNIKGEEGYVVYFSDRRGDRVDTEYLANGTAYRSTNGTVDNEDIYGPNGRLDPGEDVIDFGWNANGTSKKGTLQKRTDELPDAGVICCTTSPINAPVIDRLNRAQTVFRYQTTYFRRSLRLFNGENLTTTRGVNKLSDTKGITVSSENMVYIWGNYNTTGITGIPNGGSTLNDGGYSGYQVPSSIVADAFFPLSKTWSDCLSALYPEGMSDARNFLGEPYRIADENLPSTAQGTSVRAGILAGTTISALTALPGRDATGLRRNGGIVNYPRFLEEWNTGTVEQSWNYSGSFIPLFRSTQAISQWENDTSVIYSPPRRNWSFDTTFLTPNKLPPGTPFFQYVQATGFRQSLR